MNNQTIKKKKHTGRRIVLLNNEIKHDTLLKTARNASVKLAHFNDYMEKPERFPMAFREGDGIFFEKLNVAVLNYNKEEELNYIKKGADQKEILVNEPERYIYKIDQQDYVKGYRDGINAFYENYSRKKVGSHPYDKQIYEISKKFIDDELSSWGIKATNILESRYTGKNINIAVLDTGLYKTHNDLKGRNIITQSFFSTGSASDADGHGSHCVGITCGFNDKTGMRYGVAMNSNIYCGKVLNDEGEGTDGSILAGIEWAMKNKCSVISMSLGAPCDANDPFSQTFENVAKRAMKQGSLIIAAASNESIRPDVVSPVGHPANCPSIMAVGAIDSNLDIAWFSCGGLNSNGGQVDLVAPGVSVYSMINKQNEHEKWDGTSMATPFVSGIAALYFEQNPDATPLEVWTLLTQNAMRLDLSSIDGGSGLVQAPRE
ncbi:MAG: S8 family serine peptidase [Bacteroidales bacterium]|nr:S8 family serine peptidase [Bacteroidales bacterium]